MKVFSFASRLSLVTLLFSIISYVAFAQWTSLNTGATYSQYDISLYPNPTSGDLSIEWQNDGFNGKLIRVTNTLGQVLLTQSISTDVVSIQAVQAVDLPAGLYFLQVVANGKVLAVEKFVKQ